MVEVTNTASITSKRTERMLTDLTAARSDGCKVFLDDGRWYTDWQMGLYGPVYGYTPGWWHTELREAIERGPASSIRHRDEQIVADLLGKFYPDVEAVRFLLNGSDPCAAAVKLARAITGREKILVYGYHGTCSAYASPPTPFDPDDNRLGTMQAEREAYVSLDWLSAIPVSDFMREIAAVIVECPPVDRGRGDSDMWGREQSNMWLVKLASCARQSRALFVLDEVVTAFRYCAGGAAEYYHIRGLPDLYCFGKTLGNGFPIAALAGKKAVMDWLTEKPGGGGKVHWSNTFNGEPLGLAAAKATLQRLQDEPPWEHLYNIGEYLQEQWNALDLPWKLVGHPTRPVLEPGGLTPELNSLRRHLFDEGHIIVDHPWFVTTAHIRGRVASLCQGAKRYEYGT